MKYLGYTQVTMADLLPAARRVVTCVRYGRHLYVYEPSDSRIEHRVALCNQDLDLQKVVAEHNMDQARMYHLSTLTVEVVENVSHAWLTSVETMLELMDTLTHTHVYIDGRNDF